VSVVPSGLASTTPAACPETLFEWATAPNTLRRRLQSLPALDPTGLRQCQIEAIAGVGGLAGLEKALARGDPRALVQMATGAGKTYLACIFIYRLIKYAGAGRILFLVDCAARRAGMSGARSGA
jgi:type I restriction enzyme R subunit